MRALPVTIALCLAAGCAGRSTEPVLPPVSPATFAGGWRSVTPTLEFIRLSVFSKSSEKGVLAARLAFSGVAWEGEGRIDSDSLAMGMTIPGSAQPAATLVVRARTADTLSVQMRSAGANPIVLTLIREE